MSAVCVRCGGLRQDYRAICPSCGHRPVDDGLMVAWLLSSENLDEAKLQAAARRILEGGVIRPSDQQIKRARKALGRAFSTDPGLDLTTRLLLLGTSLVLTPLPAWICWAWWLGYRPRAAWQAFGVALPGSLLYFALGTYMVLRPLFETLFTAWSAS